MADNIFMIRRNVSQKIKINMPTKNSKISSIKTKKTRKAPLLCLIVTNVEEKRGIFKDFTY